MLPLLLLMLLFTAAPAATAPAAPATAPTSTPIPIPIPTPTPTLVKLAFLIIFFTLLRAAWLLHPSQSTKTSCDFTDISSSPIFSTSSLTMALTQPKDNKSTPCADSRSSKHQPKKLKPKSVPTTGTLATLNLQQAVASVSPIGEG